MLEFNQETERVEQETNQRYEEEITKIHDELQQPSVIKILISLDWLVTIFLNYCRLQTQGHYWTSQLKENRRTTC